MQIAMIEKLPDTEVLIHGKSQGYLGLPVRHAIAYDAAAECACASMTTAWTPTPAELEALNAGASIHVELLHLRVVPPMMVSVGKVPKDD